MRHRASLERLVETLRRVRVATKIDSEIDNVELSVHTSNALALSIYPARRLEPAEVSAILDLAGATPGQSRVFWSLLRQIPAQRHLFRVDDAGRVSVFFQTDFPVEGVARFSEAFEGCPSAAEVVRYFVYRRRSPCGVAVELWDGAPPRVRFYDMASGLEDLGEVLESAAQVDSSISASRFLTVHLCLRPSRPDLVVNWSLGGGRVSFKVESPGPRLGELSRHAVDLGVPAQTWQVARELAEFMNEERFSYVGFRVGLGGSGESWTFYIDARKLLR